MLSDSFNQGCLLRLDTLDALQDKENVVFIAIDTQTDWSQNKVLFNCFFFTLESVDLAVVSLGLGLVPAAGLGSARVTRGLRSIVEPGGLAPAGLGSGLDLAPVRLLAGRWVKGARAST